ncbi:MAG: aminopeptidase [Cyclobacteriaceae bacterium]
MRRKLWFGLLVLISMLAIWQWSMILYGLQQAKGQLKIIREAKPIEEVLADPNFPDSLKQKLRLAQDARVYAMEKLNLSFSENYTTLFDQHGEVLLWNLSACEPYALEAHTWYYPFLGSMPYKGFFDLEKAKAERESLEAEGFDTRIRPVGGWSTLGILKDPILSNMLERSEGALAEVIIHELTHATVFVKNEIAFNENLASFIGERGAELFLKEKYGDSSKVLTEYLQSEADSKRLTQYVLTGAQELDTLYTSIKDQPDSIKQLLKNEKIDKIISNLDTVSFYNTNYYQLFSKAKPNNAYFMSFKRYHAQEDTLNSIYRKHNYDLKSMIEEMKSLYGK